MPPLEQCVENAELSQEVVKLWQENFPANRTPEFLASNLPKLLLPIGALVFCALLVASVGIGYVAARNKDQANPTADSQKMNAADREMTHKIRKSIHHDKTLSSYAHNIKIISQDGKVTLRGPVRSEDEKSNLQAKAVIVAGADNVSNQLEVAPSKKGG